MKRRRLNFIIYNSKDQSPLIFWRDVILTALVWVLYFYFMRDFFIFVGDLFEWGWNGFRNDQLYPSFRILGTIASYIESLGILTILYVLWSFYNIARYGQKQRRKFSEPVDSEQTAKLFHVSQKEIDNWQKGHVLTVYHDDRGRITEVTVEK